jgi:hypothetical protein
VFFLCYINNKNGILSEPLLCAAKTMASHTASYESQQVKIENGRPTFNFIIISETSATIGPASVMLNARRYLSFLIDKDKS